MNRMLKEFIHIKDEEISRTETVIEGQKLKDAKEEAMLRAFKQGAPQRPRRATCA